MFNSLSGLRSGGGQVEKENSLDLVLSKQLASGSEPSSGQYPLRISPRTDDNFLSSPPQSAESRSERERERVCVCV